MTKQETIKKLRAGDCLNFYDKKEKLFTKIQLNKKENFICWQRFVSKNRAGNWIEWNRYLTIKDILRIRQQIINNIKNSRTQ